MPELPRLTAKDAERILLQNGFHIERQKGSHRIYKKHSHRMVLPHHTGQTLHPKIIKELFAIIEQAKGETNEA